MHYLNLFLSSVRQSSNLDNGVECILSKLAQNMTLGGTMTHPLAIQQDSARLDRLADRNLVEFNKDS